MTRAARLNTMLAALFITLTWCRGAAAEDFSHPDVTVVKPEEILFFQAQEKEVSELYGQTLRLNITRSLSKEVREQILAQGFEVRFFRMEENADSPTPWISDLVGCNVYLSIVLRKIHIESDHDHDHAVVTPLADLNWLTRNPGGTFSNGHFLMIIEKLTEADQGSSHEPNWEVFRLSTKHAREYFDAGIQLTVGMPHTVGNTLAPGEQEELVKALLLKIAQTVNRSLHCYEPGFIKDGSHQVSALVMSECKDISGFVPG